MEICEQFSTLQGEGKHLGVPSYFIRTTGCNLRCTWKNPDKTFTQCDTPFASFNPEKGETLNVDEIILKLEETNIKHIVITGGEPTMQKDFDTVCNSFIKAGFKVTLETNGTIFKKLNKEVFLSISPKLKSSYFAEDDLHKNIHTRNNANWHQTTAEWMLQNDYQIKVVVNDILDFEEILDMQFKLNIPGDKIYIMPQGITREELVRNSQMAFNECLKYGFNFTPRLHIDIFGNRRGV